eukprot:750757-Hanusia_phi.AAC.3
MACCPTHVCRKLRRVAEAQEVADDVSPEALVQVPSDASKRAEKRGEVLGGDPGEGEGLHAVLHLVEGLVRAIAALDERRQDGAYLPPPWRLLVEHGSVQMVNEVLLEVLPDISIEHACLQEGYCWGHSQAGKTRLVRLHTEGGQGEEVQGRVQDRRFHLVQDPSPPQLLQLDEASALGMTSARVARCKADASSHMSCKQTCRNLRHIVAVHGTEQVAEDRRR